MKARENILKAVRFETPDYIPVDFQINSSCWQNYPQDALFDLMESHKLLFPDFKRPKEYYTPAFDLKSRKDAPYLDDFGCLWRTAEDGISGTVTGHPLEDWAAFETYKPPEPSLCTGVGPIDWGDVALQISRDKINKRPAVGKLRHGHTFLQLADIRGYENLIFDMADEEPRLFKLIELVEQFNLYIVDKYLSMGIDIMYYPDDLGMQNTPMVSPKHFRKYIKPSYQRLMKPAREKGVIVHMHSDGYIRDLVDDIIDGGVEIINLQDAVNGIDWISQRFSGRICVELDIDRQFVTVGGTPKQIDELIREEVEKIGGKKGGLMLVYGLYPGVPIKNIKALMDAMERYALYWL